MASSAEETLRATMEKTLRKFLDGYVDASTHQDATLVSTTLTAECKRKLAPDSVMVALGAPPGPALSVKEYEHIYSQSLPVARSVSVDVTHLSVDTGSKTGAARTVYVNRYIDGEEIVLDMAWFVSFAEDGEKVSDILQYVDGLEFVKWEARARELLEKQK
ncbi:4a813086-347b-41eb-9ab3-be981dbc1c2c [Thermothielavioides terrestris]|jgi:hypothetical protein|uniref:SnoaL-like domain-containing protein n=2 Tax=Thermothielavioides terrestris TaxID=2587410 RepID=G2QTN4_THETT|nr:uncharacterized protein THITE_158372 [Thermothielavioides terrestris NRRL 8126]AEO64453.1 hypothetical protein THITE_158372 [Thermothielavioides terrestris NRRL 8126]SPQ26696.1 4a813086-347b-41eb-9ab3-be981dbc1c2c [Thermothielavioides terrestris]